VSSPSASPAAAARSSSGSRTPSHRDKIGISLNEGRIAVRLSIVVEYGTPIATVARNVIETVTFQIQRTLGMDVDRVDVNVSGLRVSDRAAGSLS
jgi:uncharacterized alkaline shock family protein YloU